jgi:anti-sigma B factor antagonist
LQQPGLTVTYSTDGECVLSVAGELDVATSPALRDAFTKLLDGDDLDDVVLDASGLSFVDSSGLAVLLLGAREWPAHGRRLVLRDPSPMLSRLLDLAGVRRAFDVEG